MTEKVLGRGSSAETPIQQQAFSLRGWIDMSIKQAKTQREIGLIKESIRCVWIDRLAWLCFPPALACVAAELCRKHHSKAAFTV